MPSSSISSMLAQREGMGPKTFYWLCMGEVNGYLLWWYWRWWWLIKRWCTSKWTRLCRHAFGRSGNWTFSTIYKERKQNANRPLYSGSITGFVLHSFDGWGRERKVRSDRVSNLTCNHDDIRMLDGGGQSGCLSTYKWHNFSWRVQRWKMGNCSWLTSALSGPGQLRCDPMKYLASKTSCHWWNQLRTELLHK